ncbi:ANL family adenylate-forming protein [Loktanella sp. DJP18]|uniref:ANL family adenylate-forming protein n=1 Tax=Loktanella sp. DJP18 TaxID=3409788 RepID=UPI003BB55DF4
MPATFHWHTSARIALASRDLAALRDAVLSRKGLRCGQDGVTTHEGSGLLCETSGSSGRPKVIRRSVGSWQASFAVNSVALGLGPQDCVAVFSGFGASLALYGALEGAHHGASLVSLATTPPQHWASTLADHGDATLYITPTQLALLCKPGRILPDVRHILVGGGTLSPAAAAAARTICPAARLTQFYGAAETSFVTWTDDATPPGSVGKPYPGVTLRLDDDGLIWVRSPYLFEGYAAGSSADTRWSDGFLSVGEVGRCDDAGNLFILGRRSRMVTVADHNVFPEAAEVCLADMVPGATVAVIALPDDLRGNRLVACIAGPVAAAPEDLARACRAALGPHAAPHRIHLMDVLPMLPSGKPDYAAITAVAQWLA